MKPPVTKVLDRKNPEAMRKWLLDHAHLSTNDQAQLAGVSAKTIRRMRKTANIDGKPTKPTPRYIRLPELPTADVPADWRTNKQWLAKMLNIYDVSKMARMVKRDKSCIKRILKRNGLATKSLTDANRSRNKCCTHEWCHRHYNVLGLSQKECAKLAGIATQTFSDWLNLFNIPVRSQHQTMSGCKTISMMEKLLIAELQRRPTVKRVLARDGYIIVYFKNSTWDVYHTKSVKGYNRHPYAHFIINKHNTKISKIPTVYYEYGTSIDNKPICPAHIAISKAELKGASLIEKRLALHDFAARIIKRGWMKPTFPEDVLQADFEAARATDLTRYKVSDGFTAVPSGSAQILFGRKIMMNFFDFGKFWTTFQNPRKLIRLLNILESKKFVEFNFFNLLRLAASQTAILSRLTRCSATNPLAYASIFKHLDITGTVLDLNVGFGSRAVACAINGIKYTTTDRGFQYAKNNHFLDFSGVNYEPYRGQSVDVVIYDDNSLPPEMDRVLPYLNITKKLLVFCPFAHANKVMQYKPKMAIKFHTAVNRNTPGYLFVW